MKIQFLLLIFLINAIDKVKSNRVIINRETNETEFTCVTADGDNGFCKDINKCNVNESLRGRLINCGNIFRGTLNQICCPINQTVEPLLDNFKNDPGCGRHFDFWNIVGGSQVKPHFLPWTVAIYQVVHFPLTSAFNFSSQKYFRFICGGTLISHGHVISAAHCAINKDPADFLIKVGAHNIETSGTLHKVESVHVHPNYRTYQRYNDISIFKLTKLVRKEYGLAACLPFDNLEIKENTPLFVAGWGTTKFLGSLSPVLKEAEVNYINNLECSKNYTQLEGSSIAYPYGIDSSMICAGNMAEGGVDSCQGDSGGPLIYNDKSTEQSYLVGVVSFGYKCASPGFPGIYTRVSTYMGWILKMMNQ